MTPVLEVLFTPAEFEALSGRDISRATCVVLDVFRATSTIVTALANGAAAIIPVAEIPDALALRRKHPDFLLAGERNGLRIGAALTGGIEFDLGNSPREFSAEQVKGKTIVLSTTNGSRALRACARAREVLVASFLNLTATAQFLRRNLLPNVLLVCSGTGREAAYEDLLCAGALARLLWPLFDETAITDSARIAAELYERHRSELLNAASQSRNGRRLLSIPDLRDDVSFCLRQDVFSLVAKVHSDSVVKIP